MEREGSLEDFFIQKPFNANLCLLAFAIYSIGEDMAHNLMTLHRGEKVLMVVTAQKPAEASLHLKGTLSKKYCLLSRMCLII